MFKLAAFLLFFTSFAFSQNKVEYLGFNFDLDKLVEREDSSVMIQNGNETGYWIWEVSQDDDFIFFTDTSVLHGQVHEVVNMKVHKSDLSKGVVDLFMKFGDNTVKNDFIFDGRKISGTVDTKIRGNKNYVEVDTIADFNVVRGFFIGLLPAMDFEVGKEMEMNFFGALQSTIFPVHFKVAAEEEVTVKSGTYDTYKIEIPRTGDRGISNTFYVTKDEPRRIVKTEVVENPMIIEFIKDIKN